ncbi:MAG: benzoyl-CoA reductase subunit C [bacterium]|nr:benzoyl-CoA reductase subunit C [bacterium]
MNDKLNKSVETIRDMALDMNYGEVRRWMKENPGAPVVGYFPAYAPREMVYAAGGLAVGIWGGGMDVEIVHGDAYYQSYICRLPRSIIDLAKQDVYKGYDGMLFPSICDVIRNLSGMWKIMFPDQWVKYLDLPQNVDPSIGGKFYQQEMRHLASLVLGREPDEAFNGKLREAIKLTNRQLAVFNRLKEARHNTPHLVPVDEFYNLFRIALVLHPEEHIKIVLDYLEEIKTRGAGELDNVRVMMIGAFCEQPPVGLLKAIERSGCYVVNHDLLQGIHMFDSPLDETGDPFESLSNGYLEQTDITPFKYQGDLNRGEELVKMVRKSKAEGVVLASPSFCDPSLLDRPMLEWALKEADIPYTSFRYAENTGQYQSIREQIGTFSDSVRLWEVH